MDGTHYGNVNQTIFVLSHREFKNNQAPGSKCRKVLKSIEAYLPVASPPGNGNSWQTGQQTI
jgi:hypothetical protein